MEENPYIIRMNISHYRELLKLDVDDVKRATVKRLLAEAEAALRQASDFEDPSSARRRYKRAS